jgi:5-formyltetrahydrofolate cyclo-ligase
MNDPALDAAKSALRLEARRRRKALQVQHPEADWMVADKVDAFLAAVKLKPGVVAAYKALGSEIDPRPLAEAMARRGWRLALPAVVAIDAPLVFRAWKPGERLAHDVAGLPAPLDSAPELEPTLILTPLLAYDRTGARLGQGGGYYDRTFEMLMTRPVRPRLIGLAYHGQEIEAAPVGPHDVPLDGFLTPAGYSPSRKDT